MHAASGAIAEGHKDTSSTIVGVNEISKPRSGTSNDSKNCGAKDASPPRADGSLGPKEVT